MENKHLIDPMDFSIEELDEIFCLAQDIMKCPKKYSKICDGKILATLFYEPSTRTRFSFEAAMMRLGGKILGFSEPNSSSASKGETIADTIRMVSIYTDIWAYQVVLIIKNTPASAGDIKDAVLIPGPGQYPGGGHSNPLQYS